MPEIPEPVDFDTRPPMPVADYAATVTAVNIGYDLVLTLSQSVLRALHQSHLALLVIGAGGGEEIARFLPGNPGWQITGVDPSQDMVALAQQRAERLGVADRVQLARGPVATLAGDRQFDAAVCLFVLHFLSDPEKSTLLRQTRERLRPGAPLLVAAGARVDAGVLQDDLLGAWQAYGELAGMPAAQMAAIISRILAQQATMSSEAQYVQLLHEAGFARVAPVLSVMNGGLLALLAR
jgi:tRNA (cmo5U34)-methyltransferase